MENIISIPICSRYQITKVYGELCEKSALIGQFGTDDRDKTFYNHNSNCAIFTHKLGTNTTLITAITLKSHI
jgi:hypothetical protein